jgi:hypothetical protein
VEDCENKYVREVSYQPVFNTGPRNVGKRMNREIARHGIGPLPTLRKQANDEGTTEMDNHELAANLLGYAIDAVQKQKLASPTDSLRILHDGLKMAQLAAEHSTTPLMALGFAAELYRILFMMPGDDDFDLVRVMGVANDVAKEVSTRNFE